MVFCLLKHNPAKESFCFLDPWDPRAQPRVSRAQARVWHRAEGAREGQALSPAYLSPW